MSDVTTLSIPVSGELARQLPAEAGKVEQLLELGLREWQLREALEAARRGEGSLAYHAQRLGLSLREMIPLAYAHGLTPRVGSDLLSGPLDLDKASAL